MYTCIYIQTNAERSSKVAAIIIPTQTRVLHCKHRTFVTIFGTQFSYFMSAWTLLMWYWIVFTAYDQLSRNRPREYREIRWTHHPWICDADDRCDAVHRHSLFNRLNVIYFHILVKPVKQMVFDISDSVQGGKIAHTRKSWFDSKYSN